MSKVYKILTCYQYRAFCNEGIKWSIWFSALFINKFTSKKAAEEKLRQLKKDIKLCDKATKLKHKFKIEEYGNK